MASRRWCVSALMLLLFAGPTLAQGKGKNPYEEMFKKSRRELPDGNNEQFNKMRNGTVALDPPTEADRTILENEARKTIYQITHFEFYSTPDSEKAELVPRSDERTISKVMTELRGKLVVITPGDANLPGPKVDFAREFGAAAVKAINEVLEKADKPVIRANAFRALAVVAESGAPAATDRVVALLEQLAKHADVTTYPVESLYYGLKAAENAIAMYDPARSADAQKWVTKDKYFTLVSLVDDLVQKVPDAVAVKTYQPDKAGSGLLSTDPKAPPKPAILTPEQVATVQAFRLQAVRALAEVKTDVVSDSKVERQRKTVVTLARVAVGDPSITPPPSFKEVGEAVIGLANATPTNPDLDATVLGAAVARGVSLFVADKASGERGGGEGGPQATHWKLSGARMKAAFAAWDANLSRRSKLAKADNDALRELGQLALTNVFDPLSKQSDNGVVTGLDKSKLDEEYNKKVTALAADPKVVSFPLFKSDANTKVTLKR